MVTIVNYGVGNVMSIKNMLRRAGSEAVIGNTAEDVQKAGKIILPGVGHFDYCMQQLKSSPFFDALQEKVFNEKVPILGVCVGCQMLMESSEEGTEKGLGWIKGKVVRFKKDTMGESYKIPHMGWTNVSPVGEQPLYKNIEEPRFYFVHSFHLETEEKEVITATAEYGYSFVASVGQGHIQGVQFHPEKSHKFGMQLYANFAGT